MNKKLLASFLAVLSLTAPAKAGIIYDMLGNPMVVNGAAQPMVLKAPPANSKFFKHRHLVNSEGLPQLAKNKDSFLNSNGYGDDSELFSYDLKIASRLTCGLSHQKCINDFEARSNKSRAQLLATGNGDLIRTRPSTASGSSGRRVQLPANHWVVSSAYWPARSYCLSIYGVSNAFSNCMGQQRILAGY